MSRLMLYALPVALLIGSNVFMTTAWYWHLRYKEVPLYWVIPISWTLALFEYCLAVPANRYGSAVYDPAQLKTIQEVDHAVGVRGVLDRLSQGGADLEPGLRLRADRGRRVLRVPQVLKSVISPAITRKMRPASLSVSR